MHFHCRWNRAPILARVSHKPIWGEESENLRFESDSYNIRVENVGTYVIGVIQFFNFNTYEFKMVEGYNIPEAKEIAGRFTPGKDPTFGVKGSKTRAASAYYREALRRMSWFLEDKHLSAEFLAQDAAHRVK